MQANRHEIEQAAARDLHRGRLGAGGLVKGSDGRATALRVAQCEAKFVGGQLKIEMKPGTERDYRSRPHRLGHRPVGGLHGAGGIQQRQGRGDGGSQLQGGRQGRSLRRRRRAAPAPPHAPPSATAPSPRDGIDRFLRGEEARSAEDRTVHQSTWLRKMIEKGLPVEEGTPSDARHVRFEAGGAQLRQPLGPPRDHARGALPRGTSAFTRGSSATSSPSRRRRRWATSRSAWRRSSSAKAIAEAKRCMSCGLCFECDKLRSLLPRRPRLVQGEEEPEHTGRTWTRTYDKCIGCHSLAAMSGPTGYIQMGLGSRFAMTFARRALGPQSSPSSSSPGLCLRAGVALAAGVGRCGGAAASASRGPQCSCAVRTWTSQARRPRRHGARGIRDVKHSLGSA